MAGSLKWSGFTVEDIQKITTGKQSPTGAKTGGAVAKHANKQHQLGTTRRNNVTRERILMGTKLSSGLQMKTHPVPKGAKLSITQILEEEEGDDQEADQTMISIKCNDGQESSAKLGSNVSTNRITATEKLQSHLNHVTLDDSDSASLPSFTALTDDDLLAKFQLRQKFIEEQNRQKKEYIKKAIADRAKKTHEEALRLNQIEDELKILDVQLGNDVGILRNQIEVATIELSDAQKRYGRAEQEFLEAKLCLFNKRERKELLTSHLYTIIEQNEMRKSSKLSRLMEKLELGLGLSDEKTSTPEGHSQLNDNSGASPPHLENTTDSESAVH